MDEAHYETTKSAENSWWYRGRTNAIKRAIKKFAVHKGAVLDVGAGYGAMFPFLKAYGPVTALEIFPPCIEACRVRGYTNVVRAESELFSVPENFSLVGAFDSLEHIEDDVAFLSKLRNTMTPDGIFIATVPAHQFLWSTFDEINKHFRRHSKKSLRTLFEKSGYDVRYISYWNCLLLVPAVIMRLMGRAGGEALTPPQWINSTLSAILYFESLSLAIAPLPMGLSLMIVATPKKAASR